MRENAVAMLSGDVERVEALLKNANNAPLPITSIEWNDSTTYVDSYLLSYVLYDALRYDGDQELFASRHIQAMLDLHKRLCGSILRPDYSSFDFISWNDFGPYFDDEEKDFLLKDGVSQQNIDLTNYGILHNEAEVIRLLQEGASPYYLNRTDGIEDECYGYFEIAPMLSILDSEMADQWQLYGLDAYKGDIKLLRRERIEDIITCLFNAAASYRILYLIEKYLSPKARINGNQLMKKYLSQEIPILRYKPKEDDKEENYLCGGKIILNEVQTWNEKDVGEDNMRNQVIAPMLG